MIQTADPSGMGAGAAYSSTSSYNPEGLRIEKTITQSGSTDKTRYFYEYSHVILETNAVGSETGYNIYGNELLLARKADGTMLYYLYNGHGDVTALVNGSGTVVASYYYDAFGNITNETGGTTAAGNSYRYSGYQYDKESGLYYLNARYYSAKDSQVYESGYVYGESGRSTEFESLCLRV